MNENNVEYPYITSNMLGNKQILEKILILLSAVYYTTIKLTESYVVIKGINYMIQNLLYFGIIVLVT